ncbi:hypothetical protein TsFJ059_009209 [Trichoderma semiorbis]|uniref:Secreted protein n=1 Tax=Trichoderma semiorbis TaxID=1491008 RepID=A0A9P8HJ26_9HYPO|nr:hypothetical protein TsFJ059_009209 [Trichoderma semiorbis]
MTAKCRLLQSSVWLLASLSSQSSLLLSSTAGAGANMTGTRSTAGKTLTVARIMPVMSQLRRSRRSKDRTAALKPNKFLRCQRCPYQSITISMMTSIFMETTTMNISTKATISSTALIKMMIMVFTAIPIRAATAIIVVIIGIIGLTAPIKSSFPETQLPRLRIL